MTLWAERILGPAGAPDILVNNAGLMNKPAPLWQVPAAEFAKVIDANLKRRGQRHPRRPGGAGRGCAAGASAVR